ncbi:sigma factor [Cohnella lupini]|uniref:RNA polymerase sigma-70 factor (ECF subfamily) n=1 Tax=Cohnella lupini TaxID=1294267 RepID=A0A3D9HQQ8_9BACL|nr:sigma factor [Cohnella lupini]RED51808.1 RNA polymerase sigma-70 factor (ECF subfamily) [Cohnella lupini]
MSELGWKTDVQMAIEGDKDAFARLIRGLKTDAYCMTKSILNDERDCEDAMQEAILNAYKSVMKLREPQFFKTWFFRILIRECQSISRHRQRTFVTNRLSDSSKMQSGTYSIDLDLFEAINRLNEDLRTLVKLHITDILPIY